MQEAGHQAIPLAHAGKPDAKHLSEDRQEIRDQDDAEADSYAYLGLLRVRVAMPAADLHLLPVIYELEDVAQLEHKE